MFFSNLENHLTLTWPNFRDSRPENGCSRWVFEALDLFQITTVNNHQTTAQLGLGDSVLSNPSRCRILEQLQSMFRNRFFGAVSGQTFSMFFFRIPGFFDGFGQNLPCCLLFQARWDVACHAGVARANRGKKIQPFGGIMSCDFLQSLLTLRKVSL